MASVSLPHRKNLSTQQALALLQEMDEADSDGGEVSFVQQATDTSSEEYEKEMEQEPNMPPRKRHRGTWKPCQSHTAKDGTVWVEEDIGMPSAVANRSCFTAQAGPTESAKRKITSVLQSFLCLFDVGMLQTIMECTVHQARRTEPDWNLPIHELMVFISVLFPGAGVYNHGKVDPLGYLDYDAHPYRTPADANNS
ncbi:solute carrier family 6 (neurotransmitter transporter, taurine) member 6 [Sarotherodon galilaeus]